MSVASRNPFALLDDDRSAAAPAAKAAAPVAAAAAPAAGNKKPAATKGPASRGGKYYARGGGGPRRDGPGGATPAGEEAVGAEPRKYDGGRGRGRGGARGGRGRGGAGGFDRKAFDRHSQTGKTDSDKKLHQGWGGDDGVAELQTEEAGATDAAKEATDPSAPTDSAATPAEGETTPTQEGRPRRDREGREREPEEEDNTVTYEQYLAKKQENDVVPKLEGVRQVEEDGKWSKGAVLLEKPEEEEAYFAGKAKSAAKPRAKKEEKVFLEFEARWNDPNRGGRGGRGRGGSDRPPRGASRARGTPRGAPRGGRGGSGAAGGNLKIDDESAFPSLS